MIKAIYVNLPVENLTGPGPLDQTRIFFNESFLMTKHFA